MRRVACLALLSMLAMHVLAPTASAQADTDCADYPTQAAAQAALAADPSDPNGLDADDDGIACEDSFGGGSTTSTPSATVQPGPPLTASPTPSATATNAVKAQYSDDKGPILPETGGFPPLMALAPLALIMGAGIVSLGIIRRGG